MNGGLSVELDLRPEIRNGNGAFLILLPNGVKVTVDL